MSEPSTTSFENPDRHADASDIIRRHSTNPTDVRDAVLADLDLGFARQVLDLGCGFGFMAEALARRVAPQAQIIGIDACAANEAPFLARVAATGRTGRFVCRRIKAQLDWPDHSLDLIVASYSLYFFPDVLPDIARVLAPHGLFLAVTHTESSCRALLRAAGLTLTDPRLLGDIRNFSVESAPRLLAPWFAEAERIDYQNALTFTRDQYDDFLTYLRFKLPLLLPESEPGGEIPRPLAKSIRAALVRQPSVKLEKNDAVFRCRGPRCP